MAQDLLQSSPLQNTSTKGNGNPFQRAQAIRRAAAAQGGPNGGPGLKTGAGVAKAAFMNPGTQSRSAVNQAPSGLPLPIPSGVKQTSLSPTPALRNPDGRVAVTAANGGAGKVVDDGSTRALEAPSGTFKGPDTAKGSNRTSTANLESKSANRTAQTTVIILGAGQSRVMPFPGNNFRILAANGPVMFRPVGGSWMTLYMGMSFIPHNKSKWAAIELQNPSATSLVIDFFCGYGKIFDNRQIPNGGIQQRPYQITGGTVGNGQAITITDVSGTVILDLNGTAWYALSRAQLVVSGLIGLTAYTLTGTQNGSGQPLVFTNFPVTGPIPVTMYPISGNIILSAAGGSATYGEIYNVLPVPLPS